MSLLLGWRAGVPQRADLLQTMADAGGLPHSPLQSFTSSELALAAAGSSGGRAAERLAVSPDGGIVVAFAGLLYDEDVTRKQRPAAYCLELYQRHGPGFAVHLNGTFAIAVWDHAAGQLHLVTDRLATRGLYYHKGAPLVFGTEIKFLLEHPAVTRRVNPDRLREFLVLEFLPGLGTYYDSIRQVPPATVMTWQGDTVTASRYWSPQFCWDRHGTVDDHAHQIAESLRNAMRRVCSGHEHVGLMLSGGMDSRVLACASAVPLECLTMHSYRTLEVELAARIAGVLDHRHSFLALDETYPLELAVPGALLSEGMHTFHHAQSWLVRPFAHEHGLSLLINGFALEALFSGVALPTGSGTGWRKLLPPRFPASIKADPVQHLLAAFQTGPPSLVDGFLRGGSAAEIRAGSREAMAECVSEIQAGMLGKHDQIEWLLIANVNKLDATLNVASIGRFTDEGIPMFDNEVIAAFLALPPVYRFHYRAYRRALKLLSPEVASIPRSWTALPVVQHERWEIWYYYRALAGVLANEARARRSDFRQYDRTAWPRLRLAMRRCPAWHSYLRERSSSSYLVDSGIVAGDRLKWLIEQQIEGTHNASRLLCAWLTLEEWLSRYG